MSNKKIGIGLLIICLCAIGWHIFNDSIKTSQQIGRDNDTSPLTTKTLIMQSTVLPTLLPHEHMVGDSMMSTSHHQYLDTPPLTIEDDIVITDITFTLNNAPASVLHHANLFDTSQGSHVCPTGHPRALVAIGEDQLHNNSLSFPDTHGIYVASGTPLTLIAMVHNPAQPVGIGGIYEDVSVTMEMSYERADTSVRQPLEYYLLHLADTPCQGENFTFTVPPNTEVFTRQQDGSTKLQPGKVVMPTDGTITYNGAHLHGWEGGKTVAVFKNDLLVETFLTKQSAESQFIWETDHGHTNIPVSAGDTISITSTYSNPHDTPLTGAMGMYGFYFAPDQDND